ncbi:MAG: exodeoxyribonuclease V subunit gamma [Desulfobacterales bacterium]|nr:exodeoxyribonuclease V subunit gamma [Desulfobacterales bacterium]
MTMHVHAGNRLEILVDELAGILRRPSGSPLVPEIVVVQSRGMQHWVSMELAERNGICANISFPFPNAFLDFLYHSMLPDLFETPALDRRAMPFRIMQVLSEAPGRDAYRDIDNYLKDDDSGIKLFQLSERIADLFDQYLVYRPDMIQEWEAGREGHWQADLWRRLTSGQTRPHRGELNDLLIQAMSDASRVPDLARLFIFGISSLPPHHLEAFVALSAIIPVHLFLMTPCREYWSDIVSERQMNRIQQRAGADAESLHLERGHPLLASTGKTGKDFFRLICGQCPDMEDHFVPSEGDTMLHCLQNDMLDLRDREKDGDVLPISDTDASIRIHVCHSPLREIEVLYDQILGMLNEDADLDLRDILVMAPDIETYAPLIHAVFGARTDPRISYSVADRGIRRQSRALEGFFSILDLKGSRVTASQVLAVLECPQIRDKFQLAEGDIETIETWIRDTGIRWGIDKAARKGFNLPDFAEHTWKSGIDRLILGYALPGGNENMFQGILPYDFVEGDAAFVLGRFLDFLEALFQTVEAMNAVQGFSGWKDFIFQTFERFFPPDDAVEDELQIVRRIAGFLSLMESECKTGPVPLEPVRWYLEHCMDRENYGSGFISGGITFCAMLPMRSIPFKAICLLGMNSEDFPRENRAPGFDLMAKSPRPGDRSRRDDDRYLFLEALISARKRFYISYVGQSIEDNKPMPPSALVCELIDVLSESFTLSSGDPADHLTVKHPLQAFSPAYFQAGSKLSSFSREDFSGSRSLTGPKQMPDSIGTLDEPADGWKQVELDAFCSFFSHSTRYLIQKRLGVFLGQDEAPAKDSEGFVLDSLEKYQLNQAGFERRLKPDGPEDFVRLQQAMGKLPPGSVGRIAGMQAEAEVERFVRIIEAHPVASALPEYADVDLQIGDMRLYGRIAHAGGHLVRTRFGNAKAGDILSFWICHLAWCAAHEAGGKALSGAGYLFCKDSFYCLNPVSNSASILETLFQIYWKGLCRPLHFFAKSAYEYMKALAGAKEEPEALKRARNAWAGSDFSTGEGQDPYHQMAFGNEVPLDDDFKSLSKAVFEPVLSNLNSEKP